MTKSTITRERLEKIKSWRETYGAGSNVMLPAEEAEELARMALAAMDSEPVAYIFKHPSGKLFWALTDESNKGQSDVMPVYAAPQPAVESDFIPKNLDKALGVLGMAIPESREEFNFQTERWIQRLIDRVIRYADEFQELPAPVVPEEKPMPNTLSMYAVDAVAAIAEVRGWNAYRAAMLQAEPVTTANKLGNSPVIPDGYVMVPMRLTAENGAKVALYGEFSETKFVNCPECFGDDECETCDGSGRIEITVPVSWTTIKEIWAKGVEHFAAAPQEVK